jgi:hypothetical protein
MQSLLASLSSSAEEAAVKPADAASTLALGGGSSLNQSTKIGSEETVVSAKVCQIVTGIGVSSARTTAGVAKAALSSTKEKQPETESKKESVKGASTAASAPQAATEAVSTVAVSDLLPTAIATPAQPAPIDLSSPNSTLELQTGTATTSLDASSSSIEVPGPIGATPQAPAQASGNQTADGDRPSVKEVKLSPSVSTNELRGPALNRTDLPDAQQEDATVSVATRDTGANSFEKTVLSQSTSATAVSNHIPAEPAAKSQGLTLTSASSQVTSAVIQQGQDGGSVPLAKQMDASSPALVNGDSPDHLAVTASTVAVQSGQPLPVSQVAEKPSTTASAKGSTAGVSRSSREAGKSNSDLKISRLVDGQVSDSNVDALAVSREAANAHGSARPAGEFAQTSTTEAANSDSREAFSELDAGDGAGKPTWIHAGSQRAEAGFQDPALGWVGVRADTSGGGVHAQLVPGSADAAQTLTGHLSGLNAYLTEHHTPVETLTLSAPDSGWTGPSSDQGQGQSMQQNTGQQTRQDADSGSQSSSSGNSPAQSASSETGVFQPGIHGSAASAGGIHISVMA